VPEISDEQLAEYERLRDDSAAADLYGSPALGGGTPSGAAPTEQERWVGDFQARFDDPSAQVSVHEIERYARMLGGAHLAVRLAENSQVFKRHGISSQMIRDSLEGKTRQRRPPKAGVGLPPRG
jgi:hypothetical protein